MKKVNKGTFFARTDRGLVRLHNEDQASILLNSSGDILLVVADGMGGYQKGDYASKIAIDILTKEFTNHHRFWGVWHVKRFLSKVVKTANKIIYQESQNDKNYENMGTTVVAAIIHKDKLITLNIGDSRIYLLDNKKLVQASEDQTVVRYLINTGQITEEEAKTHPKRHVLLNAMGNTPTCSVYISTIPYTGQTLLLCSDGLYNNVNDDEIERILSNDDTTEQKGEMLIKVANSRGGNDNIAVSLWERHHG